MWTELATELTDKNVEKVKKYLIHHWKIVKNRTILHRREFSRAYTLY